MIAHVRGTLAARGKNHAVVDVGGVGYAVWVPERCLPAGNGSSEVILFTYTAVKEDAIELFGFSTPQDREFFKLLISITGIGPKASLNILSSLDAASLARAILKGDDARLVKVPGIGKKTAARIILELKEKVSKLATAGDDEVLGGLDREAADVVEVLEGLGCAPDDAREVVGKVQSKSQQPPSFDDLLSESLLMLAQVRR